MANTTPILIDLFNSPEHNGEMNESVRKQIEQALAKTKNTKDKPKRKSRSSKKSSKATASLSELISSPEYTEEMNESVQKQIEQALAKQAKKKKLPTKPKIDLGDSVVVVDKNENVSTVVPAEAKPQGNVPVEAKAQESQGDRQSFKGMAKAGALSLGSSVFNKMFPTLGKGLDILKSRLEKQEKNTADNNVANKSYSRQVERSSVFLNTMSENLNKTNDILQQILVVVNRNATNNQTPAADGGMGGFPNIDLPDGNRGRSQPRKAQTVPNTQSGTKPRMTGGKIAAIGAGAAAAGAAGYMAYNAITGGNRNSDQPTNTQPAAPTPQSPPAAAPGTTHDIITGAPIGAAGAPAATRTQTPTPAATVNPAEAARAREEALNAAAQRYQASVEERASVERERAALEERYGQTDTERTIRPEPGSNVRFSPYKVAAYSDPEAQRQHSELLQRESQAEIQRNASFRSAARNVANTRTGGLLGEDADVTPEMIQALTTRYGYTPEQLQSYGGGATQENFVRVGGIYYAGTIRRLFDDELKKDLERRAAATQQPVTPNNTSNGSDESATPVQTATVTPSQNVTPTPAATPIAPQPAPVIPAPNATIAPTPQSTTTPTAIPVTQVRSTENVNLQAFREKDPEGFQEFTNFVRNRQREIVREEIQKLPPNIANIDPVSTSMFRISIESQARSVAQQEGIERFKDRLNAAGARSSQTSINDNPVTGPDATRATSVTTAPYYSEEAAAGATRPYINPEYSEEAAAGATRPYINPETPNRGEPTPEIPNTENLISSYQEITNRYQSLMDLLNDQGDFAINILAMDARYIANRNFLGRVSTGNNTYDTSIIQRLIANLGNIESRRLELLNKVSIAFRNCLQFRAQLARLQSSNFVPSGINSRIESDNKQLETFVSDYNKLLSDFNSIEENNGREDATPVPSPIPDSQIYDRGEPTPAASAAATPIETPTLIPVGTPAFDIDVTASRIQSPRTTTRARATQSTRREGLTANQLNGMAIDAIANRDATKSETVNATAARRRIRQIMDHKGDDSGVSGKDGDSSGDAVPKSASQEAQDVNSKTTSNNPDGRDGRSADATPEASGAVNPMTADPSGFNARILNVRAQEILFKADKFEYSEGFQLATGSPTPTPGPTPGPAAGGEGASSVGGSTPTPTAAAASGSTSGAASAAPAAGAPGVTQIGSANITGLDFAVGVDQRIKPGIADKTKEIQSAFGKKLMVTSGFRDPARNSRVGGAGGSKHLTGDAVDVQFPGNQQETIDFIKVASEKGAGGIGVYRPGFLHIDTGAKRVWGPDYKATSIPDWAKPALDEHMGKPASQSAGGGAAAGGGETASPMPGGQQQAAAAGAASPSAAAATPEPSSPSSGAAMSSASVTDETASRPSAGPTPPPPDATAPITAAPQGPSLPGIDPNNPGSVEPADAAIRYSRLFNMAA
jgi:hypothetical protein